MCACFKTNTNYKWSSSSFSSLYFWEGNKSLIQKEKSIPWMSELMGHGIDNLRGNTRGKGYWRFKVIFVKIIEILFKDDVQ